MAGYDKLIATARRLLHRKGTEIYLIKPAVVNENSATPWRGSAEGAADSEIKRTKGVRTNYQKNEIDGKNILFSDRKFTIPVADINNVLLTEEQISNYKFLLSGSKKYRIVGFDVVKPGDQVIVYKLQARS